MPIIGGLCYLGNHVCMSHSISCLILLPTFLNIVYYDIYLFYIAYLVYTGTMLGEICAMQVKMELFLLSDAWSDDIIIH